ncbi:MAG: nitrilase-related carbon-nitrogen hydrolase [Cloacibacterium normanense]
MQNDLCKDKETNLQKAIEKVRAAAAKGAQIVCLQELFTSLYFVM